MADPDKILYQSNYYKPLIDKAMRITRDYVSEHKLILTGGMAIDLALRAKGKSIYDDDTLPDYDIISDKNLYHATALAEKLCKAGLPDVNVINAIHITTVKVRIKRVVFLDSTYVPPLCMERIPYLDIDDLRVVHPHYQFIDQRHSLSHLMSDTGLSLNIFNRLTKDVNRNRILRSLYPIQSNPDTYGKSSRIIKIPIDFIKINEKCLKQIDPEVYVYTGPACITGYLGYLIMMALFDNTLNKLVVTDSHLEVSIPKGIPVRIISCDIESIKPNKKLTMYRPLLGLKPVSQTNEDFEFVDTYGARIGCNIIELPNKLKVCVGSVDFLLMEMLRDRIYINKEPYSSYYCELVDAVDKKQLDEMSSSEWCPSLNCYGIDDLPEYRVFMLEKLMNPDTTNDLKPKSSYPFAPKCITRSKFDEANSHYFRIDGIQDNSLQHSSYKYIVESFKDFLDKKRNPTERDSSD